MLFITLSVLILVCWIVLIEYTKSFIKKPFTIFEITFGITISAIYFLVAFILHQGVN